MAVGCYTMDIVYICSRTYLINERWRFANVGHTSQHDIPFAWQTTPSKIDTIH